MKLLHKIISILSILIIICTLVALISMTTITNNFKEFIIKSEISDKESSIKTYISITSTELFNRVSDIAIWDDFFYNLENKAHEWIEENCTKYLLYEENYHIDLVYVESDDNKYIKYYGSYGDKELISRLDIYEKLLKSNQIIRDYVTIDDHLVELVGSRVFDGDKIESNGIFIIGRVLDKTFKDHLPGFISQDNFLSFKFNTTPTLDKSTLDDNNLIIKYDFYNSKGDLVSELTATIVERDLIHRISSLSLKTVTAVGLSALLALIFISILAKKLTDQIGSIILEIHNISNGEYSSHLEGGTFYETSLLAKSINKLSTDMNQHKDQLERSYFEGIQTLVKTLETVDAYTKGHSERVSFYSVELGRKCGLSPDELEHLRLAALMHDFGKIGIPSTILNKTSQLTEAEFNSIKEHPMIGYEILEISHMFSEFKDVIKYHHERYDGNGYPMKLSGDNIPFSARILAVVDSFDAMTSDRAYREAMPLERALKIIKQESGKQFDPKIVELFLDIAENLFNESNKLFSHIKN